MGHRFVIKFLYSDLNGILFKKLKDDNYTYTCILIHEYNTVKPVLSRGHPTEGQKVAVKKCDPFIQVHLHCILVQGTQKMWLHKTGDP